MKKVLGLLFQGVGLGFGIGLCLAGAVGLVFRAIYGGAPDFHMTRPLIYFFVVGVLMGLLGGWCLAVQMILGNLLTSLFLKIFELVPMPAQVVGDEWGKKMETFFQEVLKPFPGFFRKFVEFFFLSRFDDYDRINRSLDKARQKHPAQKFSPQWMAMVVLGYFLEPLWIIFYIIYAILFLASLVFWSFPFFR